MLLKSQFFCSIAVSILLFFSLSCGKTYDYSSRLAEAQRPWLIGSSIFTLFILFLVVFLFVKTRRTSKRLEVLVRKRTQDLEIQTTTLTTLFDSIPDLIFTLDTSLRFTQCNKSFLEHFGLHKEDIINKYEDSLRISAEIIEAHNNWNRKVIEEGQTFVIDERIPRVDGTQPLYETVKAPLILNGKVVGVLGIAHNITERKKMEEAALAASHSKSAFLANMSHEIRTPMNSIVGFSELALDGEVSPRTRDYLGKIHTNAEWLLQIVNDILDISKIESGKMEMEHIPFDMRELFASCRTLIMPKAIEKGIQLHFYAEPSIGQRPLGDPTRLRQVIVNLLSNAIKFTNNGIVKLHAAITGKTGKTITMHFEVKDSGIGMTEEQIEKIFEPFVQAETGTTRKYGGTGLGLPITRNIIEMMGGKLSVESMPGLGSKFSFDLTFSTVEVSSDEMFERKIAFNEFEKPVFEGEVLLCEDNVMNQQVICEHLKRVGLKTVIAENGKRGVEIVESRMREGKKQFDLIFMDMHMPVMDGLDAAAKILELKANVPIVAMTANIMANDMDIYRNSGMHDCVGKPFTSQELWKCLMKYFRPVSGGTVISKKANEKSENQQESDLEFQKRLGELFIKNNENKIEEITKALEADDIKLAHRLVHTLKGNAGQIGRVSLQKAAADVEMQLKDGKNLADPQQIAILKTELDAALAELKETLK
ncbi:MAG: response regulator [Treponema sp.]|jgi:PAS domain S-box-containing protein|nr:response regulator [Treponema sp.]